MIWTRPFLLAVALAMAAGLPAPAQLPSGWTDQDIGTCAIAGSAAFSGGTFTVKGSGKGFTGTADSLNFCYQTVTGDFTFVAHMISNTGYSGLHLRESLATNARGHFVYTFEPSAPPVWTRVRTTTGGTAAIYSGPTLAYPLWVKMQRLGDFVVCYTSSDAVHWLLLFQQTYTGLAATLDVGFAVSDYPNTTLQTAVFDNVSLGPVTSMTSVPGTVKTSWIGNTFGNGPAKEQVQYNISGLYAAPDGTCYANDCGLEVNRQFGVYKDGATVGFMSSSANGGAAVTGDGTYLYYAQEISSNGPPSGTAWYTVSRVNQSTLAAAPFTGGYGPDGNMVEIGSKASLYTPGNVWGLACDPTTHTLYASDTLNGKIDVLDTTTMSISSSWIVPAGYHPYALTWDPLDHLLWAVVQDGTGARQVWAFDTSGVVQTGRTITGAANPVSLAYYVGHLYVADNGPDQNIKTFSTLTTPPAPWTYYGGIGGSFGGTNATIGTMGDWRLNGLTAISIDGHGNIYVACNGYGPDLNEDGTYRNMKYGGTLESYSLGTRALNWRLQSFEFMDVANIDPGDETSAYGATVHYKLDWDNTDPGTEWTGQGNTLNFWRYPTDWRLSQSNTNFQTNQVLRIGGQRFLLLSNNYQMTFYRFSSATGETAIPCVEFNGVTSDPGHVGLAIWTDANGDGAPQPSEWDYANTYVNPYNAAYIDTNGTLWSTTGTNVIKFPCTLSGGIPHYAWSTHVLQPFPSTGGDQLTQGGRIVYDAASDTMYLLGFTTNYPVTPGTGNAGAGSVVMCYTHWSTTPVLAWETPLPIVMAPLIQNSFGVEAMAGAGKYLFLQFIQNEQTLVLDKATGAQVGSIYPDPEVVGTFGFCDYTHSVSAFQRANGEYIITVEDDDYNKSVMYRWTGAP